VDQHHRVLDHLAAGDVDQPCGLERDQLRRLGGRGGLGGLGGEGEGGGAEQQRGAGSEGQAVALADDASE